MKLLGWSSCVLFVAGLSVACSGQSPNALVSANGNGSDGSCLGAERCDCYPNGTCNAGLTCLSEVCVNASGIGSDASAGADGPSGSEGGVTDGGVTDPPMGSTMEASAITPNLITDGDFSGGAYDWHLLAGFDATAVVVGTEYCVTLNNSKQGGIGWPPVGSPGVSLTGNQAYFFAYTSRLMAASTVASVDAKVGESTQPYTVDFEAMADPVGPTPMTHMHPFTEGAAGDSSAGVSFFFSGNQGDTVCFSNVSLAQN